LKWGKLLRYECTLGRLKRLGRDVTDTGLTIKRIEKAIMYDSNNKNCEHENCEGGATCRHKYAFCIRNEERANVK